MNMTLLSRNQEALTKLNRAWLDGKLTIVVGAGVSAGAGLPLWNALLSKMLDRYVEVKYSEEPYSFFKTEIRGRLHEEFANQSPLTFAHYIQTQLPREEFIKILHASLYDGFITEPEPSPLALTIAGLGAKLHSILSFNFDGLMETALGRLGVPHTPIWTASQLSGATGLPVYHPHGYLPYILEPGQSYEIVFAESDYHTQYSSQFSWNNIVTIRALLESTCLFVGASLTDPNQRRLLDNVYRQNPKAQHYFMWRVPNTQSMTGTDKLLQSVFDKIFESSYSTLGLTPLYVHEWEDMPTMIDNIKRIR